MSTIKKLNNHNVYNQLVLQNYACSYIYTNMHNSAKLIDCRHCMYIYILSSLYHQLENWKSTVAIKTIQMILMKKISLILDNDT